VTVLDALRPRAFSAPAGRWFLGRRVLDTRDWSPPGYFNPLTTGSVVPSRRSLRRLVPSRAYLTERYGSGSYARLYRQRVRAGVANLRAAVPADVLLTRWMRLLA
jgi:hypothetical protein